MTEPVGSDTPGHQRRSSRLTPGIEKGQCGYDVMVAYNFAKVDAWVRFPLPAPVNLMGDCCNGSDPDLHSESRGSIPLSPTNHFQWPRRLRRVGLLILNQRNSVRPRAGLPF